MHTDSRLRLVVLAMLLVVLPVAGMSQSHNCRLVAEADVEYGALATEVKQYVPEAAALAVCVGQRSSASMVLPLVVTKVSVVDSVRTFSLVSPYLYRNRFPTISTFQGYMQEAPAEPRIRFICLIRNQCRNLLEDGYVMVGEEIAETQYSWLVDMWNNNDTNKDIFSFEDSANPALVELKALVRSGGVLLPIAINSENFGNLPVVLNVWLNGQEKNGVVRIWQVAFAVRAHKLSILSISWGELE